MTAAALVNPPRLRPADRAVLDRVLWSRRWQRVSYPFRHVVADDVLVPDFYADLEAQVLERWKAGRFGATMPGYDAVGYTVTKVDTGPLALFHSRAWHDLIADIMGVDATGDVNISLHHHAPGSASGEVHNDLNPGWFVDNGGTDDISVADPALCGYWFGENARGHAYERIRAVAVLLYLANPEWRPGDGGETGLYAAATDPVDRPAAAIPPRNNSLLAFECTPASYHSFLTNRRVRRMSLIMWLHRPKDHVIRRWGEDSIVYWG